MSHKYESFVKALRAFFDDATTKEIMDFVKALTTQERGEYSQQLNDLGFTHPTPAGALAAAA